MVKGGRKCLNRPGDGKEQRVLGKQNLEMGGKKCLIEDRFYLTRSRDNKKDKLSGIFKGKGKGFKTRRS